MAEKAGRWLRVSSGGQDEASQIPDVDEWCGFRGYDVSQPPYIVHGGSAFKGNRKFDRMWSQVLADIRAGRITVLVVWKQDRLDRKLQTFQMIAQVVDAGGRVEFVTQPHLNDLSTMGGRIALKVQEEIAYEESRLKSDRIKIKHNGLRQAGSVIGRAPYGFTNICEVCQHPAVRPMCNPHRKIMIPVPEEASVIQDAAEWYLSGMTLDDICSKLNANDRLPRRMRNGHQPQWHAKTLSGALRNPAVVGRRKNGEGFTVKPQAILRRATYDAVCRRMDVRSTRKGVSQAKTPALLTGVIRCGKCGRNMSKNGAAPWQGYHCRTKGCKSFVLVTVADAFVCQAMSTMQHRDTVEVLIRGGDHDAEIAEVKRDMQDAITAEDFGRLADLKVELDRLRSMPATPARVERREADVTVADMWQALNHDSERRAFLLDRQAVVTFDGKSLTLAGPFIREAQPEALPVAA